MAGLASKSTFKLKPAQSSVIGTKLQRKGKGSSKTDEDDFEEWKKARALLKPPDQLNLTDMDLKEEIARVLTTANPQIPSNIVEYNYAEGAFVPVPPPGNTVVYIDLKGTTLHKESDEAQLQIMEFGADAQIEVATDFTQFEDEIEGASEEPGLEGIEGRGEGVEEGVGEQLEELEEQVGEEVEAEEQVEEDAEDEEKKKKSGGRAKKLTNQFNFSERAALTYNMPSRCQETQTIPPPRATFSDQVYQWVIFDAYAEDFAAQQREKEKEKKIPLSTKKPPKKAKQIKLSDEVQKRLFAAWKTLERMVNLNSYDDIAKDYRYWEDPADEYREEEGTLLPLWKFIYDKTHKKNMVTDMMFNPWYYDLFAVCFGSLDFMTQGPGAMCLFSMKNPSYPEYICLTECGCMCVDIHPKYPFMIAVGLYDGSILIYNLQVSCTEPQFQSNAVTNKHTGIVWEIKWVADLQDGEMNFFSASADGKINNWVLMLSDLSLTTIITLDLDRPPVPGPDGTFIKLKGSATCMKFHPKDPLIFLVGTEEGLIYKCSTLYSATYLFTYKAHHMPVYRIDFNYFNPNIFISCSGDWRIKIWEDQREEALFVFDLGSPVGGVRWASYSSTVFAACCSDGFVFVYDLNVNKYKAVCKQAIVSKKKTKLTRLCFNYDLAVLIVGDDRGCVHTLKISPNLRIPCKPPKKMLHLDQFTLQCMKLDKLLSLVREPQILEPPPDMETVVDS